MEIKIKDVILNIFLEIRYDSVKEITLLDNLS